MASEKGNRGGGRKAGARNRLGKAALEDLLADWQEGGKEAIKLMRLERPSEYVRAVLSTLPKEFLLESASLSDIDDATLDLLLAHVQQLVEQQQSMILIEGKSGERINGNDSAE
jgi:hypothetical protein